MAVIIDTAHCVPSMFGTDAYGNPINGFTVGNSTGAILPTEVHSDWFNTVQQTINTTILYCSGNYGLQPLLKGVVTDLGQVIEEMHQRCWPRTTNANNNTYFFRSQADDFMPIGSGGKGSGMLRKTEYKYQLANSTNTNMCSMFPGAAPLGCTMTTFRVCVTQTDLGTNYGCATYHVSGRLGAIGTITTAHSDIPLAGLVFTPIYSAGSLWIRVTIPAVPAGKVFNACVSAETTLCF